MVNRVEHYGVRMDAPDRSEPTDLVLRQKTDGVEVFRDLDGDGFIKHDERVTNPAEARSLLEAAFESGATDQLTAQQVAAFQRGGVSLRSGPVAPRRRESLDVALTRLGQIDPFPRVDGALRKDADTQAILQRAINKLGLGSRVANKELAVVWVDFTGAEHGADPRFAGINEKGEMACAGVNAQDEMYAASLPKVGIAFGIIALIHAGELSMDDKVVDALRPEAFTGLEHLKKSTYKHMTVGAALRRMIGQSNNYDARLLHQHIGLERLQSMLRQAGFDDGERGIWLGRYYMRSRPRIPRNGGSQNATAYHVARLYGLLATEQLFSPETSRTALEGMTAINQRTGLVLLGHKMMAEIASSFGYLAPRPDNPARKGYFLDPDRWTIVRKSGSWKKWHADSVYIVAKDEQGKVVGRHVLVILGQYAESKDDIGRLTHEILTSQPGLKAAAGRGTHHSQRAPLDH